MSRLSGVALIVAGLGVGAYALPWSNEASVRPATSDQTSVDEQVNSSRPIATSAPVTPPQIAAAAPAAPPAVAGKQLTAPAAPVPAAPKSPAAGAPSPTAKAPKTAEPVALVPSKPVVVRPTEPVLDRAGLARELQRQLKRVGCYDGEINGVWTPGARKSMKVFTDRVNASLPVEQPDYILLAMVQGHQGLACSRTCPGGQDLAEDGRCLPKAVVAAASKKRGADNARMVAKAMPQANVGDAGSSSPTTTVVAGTRLLESADPPMGRMALAGPRVEDKRETPVHSMAAPPAAREKHDARQRRHPRRARYVDGYRSREWRRAEAWRARGPSWVPWTQSRN